MRSGYFGSFCGRSIFFKKKMSSNPRRWTKEEKRTRHAKKKNGGESRISPRRRINSRLRIISSRRQLVSQLEQSLADFSSSVAAAAATAATSPAKCAFPPPINWNERALNLPQPNFEPRTPSRATHSMPLDDTTTMLARIWNMLDDQGCLLAEMKKSIDALKR